MYQTRGRAGGGSLNLEECVDPAVHFVRLVPRHPVPRLGHRNGKGTFFVLHFFGPRIGVKHLTNDRNTTKEERTAMNTKRRTIRNNLRHAYIYGNDVVYRGTDFVPAVFRDWPYILRQTGFKHLELEEFQRLRRRV